jgi:anaerobic selenocysteine-containing dehydrogenase
VGEQTVGSAGAFGLGAVHLLNALRARSGSPGCVVTPDTIPMGSIGASAPAGGRIDGPPIASVAGIPVWRALGGFETEGRAPPFDILFLEDGAAMADVVEGDPASRLLAKIPLVVSFASALDASTAAADVVLPSTSYFEQALDVEIDAGGFVAVAAARPALPPLLDARSPAQVLPELVRRSGRDPNLGSEEQVVRQRLGGLYRARRGMAYGTPFRRGWMAQMEEAGWWTPASSSEGQFVDSVFESGGWIDPRMPRPSFSSERPYGVDARGRGFVPQAKALFAQGDEDDAWLPHNETAPSSPGTAQGMLLVPFTVGVLRGRGSPNRPSLLALAAPHLRAAFHPWAELNPTDARRLGVESGGKIRIASEHGNAVVSLRVTEGVRPGTVALASAPAAGGAGRYARSWKAGSERLLTGIFGRLTGARTGRGLRVQVEAEPKGAA